MYCKLRPAQSAGRLGQNVIGICQKNARNEILDRSSGEDFFVHRAQNRKILYAVHALGHIDSNLGLSIEPVGRTGILIEVKPDYMFKPPAHLGT